MTSAYALTREGSTPRRRRSDPWLGDLPFPTTGNRTFRWFNDPPGFGLVNYPSGKMAFVYRYGSGANTRRKVLGPALYGPGAISFEEARTRAIEWQARLRRGLEPERPRVVSNEAGTLRAVARDFMRQWTARPSTKRLFGASLHNHIFETFGDTSITDLQRAELNRHLERVRLDTGAQAAQAARKYLNQVGRYYEQFAPDGWSWPRLASQLQGYTPRQSPQLQPHELRAIWHACPQVPVFGDLIRFLLATGLRRCEAALLTRAEVSADFTMLRIGAGRYKTNVDLELPLSGLAADILRSRPAGEYFFANADGRPYRRFGDTKAILDKAAGVRPWIIHDLRKASATLMGNAGISDETVDRVLGHKRKGVTGLYNTAAVLEAKRQAVETLAECIRKIVEGSATA
jgi:integrase